MNVLAWWLFGSAMFTIGWCVRVAFEQMSRDPFADMPDTLRSHRARQRELGLREFDEAKALRTLPRAASLIAEGR